MPHFTVTFLCLDTQMPTVVLQGLHVQYGNALCRFVLRSNRLHHTARVPRGLCHRDLCKRARWCPHNDEVT